jgi:hypothetical protein
MLHEQPGANENVDRRQRIIAINDALVQIFAFENRRQTP